MKLAEYQAREGLNLTRLAERLDRPVSTVHGWLRGKTRPDWASLARIAEATRGAVTASDFADAPPAAGGFAEAQAPLAPPLPPADAPRPRTARERASAGLDSLREEALSLGLDPDRIARHALSDAIGAERGRRWQEENREAIEAHNRWVEEHGLPLAEHRMF